MFVTRSAHCAFILLLIPLSMLSMDTSEKILAVPLCAPDKTVWHATFAGDGQEIKPTVMLSRDFFLNVQDIDHFDAHAHLQGKKKQEDNNKPTIKLSHDELIRMHRKNVRIDFEGDCEYFLTDFHEITYPAYGATGTIAIKHLSSKRMHNILLTENNNPKKYTPWCAINVTPENPIVITTHQFLKNRKIHCVDHIAKSISTLRIPMYDPTQKRHSSILTINASPCSEEVRKIALAIREHTIINDKKIEYLGAYLINVTRGNSGKLELRLQESFPITLQAHESFAGLGWTTNGEKLVILRKQEVYIASSNLILETYSPISGKRIARTNMPIASCYLEAITELSNDHSLLIAYDTLATTPRTFVLDNAMHDMKKELPSKDLPRASAHNIISLLRHRELNGSKIAYHRAAAQQAI